MLFRSQSTAPATLKYPTVKPVGDKQQSRYDVLSTRKIFPTRYPDFASLIQLGIRTEWKLKLAKVGWQDLDMMDDPSYGILTCEFLSSFTVTDDGLLSFRIANKHHQISKTELATMFGWQLVEQQQLPDAYATPFWLKITGLPSTTTYKAKTDRKSVV